MVINAKLCPPRKLLMIMKVLFHKMHGAGNDFIMFAPQVTEHFQPDPVSIAALCNRRSGIGADGVVMLQVVNRGGVRARFFNADGSEADMCGNGARCVARMAYDMELVPRKMLIETKAGRVKAEILPDTVRIEMPQPSGWLLRQAIEINRESFVCNAVNTGVPHAVMEVNDISGVDVQGLGSAIRYHQFFSPEGVNVDFMMVTDCHSMRMRTYERGVESETQACGTGATACALIAGRFGMVVSPVKVVCASGDELVVNFKLTSDGAEAVSLSGPACHVFQGEFELFKCRI